MGPAQKLAIHKDYLTIFALKRNLSKYSSILGSM